MGEASGRRGQCRWWEPNARYHLTASRLEAGRVRPAQNKSLPERVMKVRFLEEVS